MARNNKQLSNNWFTAKLGPLVKVTPNTLVMSDNTTLEQWEEIGIKINQIQGSVNWWLGNWWAFGDSKYGDRLALVESDEWEGPNFQSCANIGSVCRKFKPERRREGLSFTHHVEVARLPEEEADRLLDWCEKTETGKPKSVVKLRVEINRNRDTLIDLKAIKMDIDAAIKDAIKCAKYTSELIATITVPADLSVQRNLAIQARDKWLKVVTVLNKFTPNLPQASNVIKLVGD